MTESQNFIDELLNEAEVKEQQLTLAHYDLIIAEIGRLYDKIEATVREAESEIQIINDWALNRNSKTQDKINLLERKLEAYIRESGQKTIELAHGTLKLRKNPDKVEVRDLELFLKNAGQEMLTIIPESVKPNLNGIKSVIRMSGKIPDGVEVIAGQEEFSVKLNKEVYNDAKTEA